MTVDGAGDTLSIIVGLVVFKTIFFRHLAEVVHHAVGCGGSGTGGLAHAGFAARGEQESRESDNGNGEKTFFHHSKISWFKIVHAA